jgi:hypothetical protein
MHDLLNVRTQVYPQGGAAITTNLVDFGGSTGVAAVMNFAVPVEIVRMGIVVDDNELLDVGAGFTITLKKYLVPGSATNAVTLGSITRIADVPKGGVVYNDFDLGDNDGEVAEDGTTRNLPVRSASDFDTNDFIVLPGQQIVWDLTDAADTSGKGQVFVQYIERPFAGPDIAAAIKVTA